MKKNRILSSVTLMLALLMICSCFSLSTLGADDEPVFYDFRIGGNNAPYGIGRTGANCYFPQSSSLHIPEFYTWGSCNLSLNGGFLRMSAVNNDVARITFDTCPKDMYIKDWLHNYMAIVICADKAFTGNIRLKDLGSKYQKDFPVEFTGKWQVVVLDLAEISGWLSKDASDKFTIPMSFSPYSAQGNSFFGGFQIQFPGKAFNDGYYFDSLGFFTDKNAAENYVVKAKPGEQLELDFVANIVATTPILPKKTDEKPQTEEFVAPEPVALPQTPVSAPDDTVFYDFRSAGGDVPFEKGRVGSDCYFPHENGYKTPEWYVWKSAELSMKDGFLRFENIDPAFGRVTFDTCPKDMYIKDWLHNYMAIVICSDKAFTGNIRLKDLGSKYQKDFPVKFTGKWQVVVLDLAEISGWLSKDASDKFTLPMSFSPYSAQGNSFFGGFQIQFPGKNFTPGYYLDSIGFFSDKAAAEGYYVNAKPDSAMVESGKADSDGNVYVLEVSEPMQAVTYYKQKAAAQDMFLYELRPEYGDIIPYGVSKYPPTKAYYNTGCAMTRPEMYTWGSGTLSVEGDYFKFAPTHSDVARITFDTSPKSYYMDYNKPYFTFVVKTSKAFDGELTVQTLDSLYRKTFKISYTGEWQKIILDFSDITGWEVKDADGKWTPTLKTPFCSEINKLYGGHQLRFNGSSKTEYYLFDYIAMFPTREQAVAFDGLAKVESTLASVQSQRTLLAAKSRLYPYFMSGYTDGTFKPNKGMTRAEACTVIARLLGEEYEFTTERTTRFSDLKPTDWHYGYITFLESLGILDAFDGEFNPNRSITRGEFVNIAFEANAFGSVNATETVFSDVNSQTPFSKEIAAATASKAVNGYTDGTFRPDNTITRAEITTILVRILDIAGTPDAEPLFSDLNKNHWAYGGIMAVIKPEPMTVDYEAGNAKIAVIDSLAEQRKQQILGTKTDVKVEGTSYYVSADGDDSADGKSPESAWKTLSKVSTAALSAGDGVFFRRGDIFRGTMRTKNGVTYSAYGEGEKPRIYGSPENGADPGKWELCEGTTNIWRYKTPMIDQGTLVFDDGKQHAIKVMANFVNGKFINENGGDFVISEGLADDLYMFCDTMTNLGSDGYPVPSRTLGYLYLRSDSGNPGERFGAIEFMPSTHIIRADADNYYFKDVTIDNLCVMYGGAHGIHGTYGINYTVQNCIFGWIGGGVQSYTGTTSVANLGGRPVRFGNAVEIGFADGHTVKNCYVYECYDCGLTFQTGNGSRDEWVKNVTYEGNLIENCTYSIECFMGSPKTAGAEKYIENFVIRDNIMRKAGYGFGKQRPDKTQVAHVKTWNHYNRVKDRSFVIENNIFDRSTHMIYHTGVNSVEGLDSLPVLRGNTYVQHETTKKNTSVFGIYSHLTTRAPYDGGLASFFKANGINDAENVYFVK